jgi:hypothetical protein
MKLWIIRARIAQALRTTVVASVCEHETKVKGLITTPFGAVTVYRMPPQPDYCLRCLGQMSVQCACCGKPVWIGDKVTLYQPDRASKLPKYVYRLHKDSNYFVACTRSECAKTRKSVSGRWLPPGEVKCDSSPTETVLSTRVTVSLPELRGQLEDELMLATEMQREEAG